MGIRTTKSCICHSSIVHNKHREIHISISSNSSLKLMWLWSHICMTLITRVEPWGTQIWMYASNLIEVRSHTSFVEKILLHIFDQLKQRRLRAPWYCKSSRIFKKCPLYYPTACHRKDLFVTMLISATLM